MGNHSRHGRVDAGDQRLRSGSRSGRRYGAPGSYVGPQWLRESRGRLGEAKLSRHAANADLARKLWDVSEASTGVTFDLSL